MSRTQAVKIAERLTRAGHRALFAGGAVRDRLLGRPHVDVDIATDATPAEVARLFPRALPVGESFGVVKVPTDDGVIDVATFRRDVGIGDGRRPARVERASLEEDVQRRDFTINGLMEDPSTGQVIDLVGGLDDLRARRVRAIGEPGLRFEEDGLRLLRGVRFAVVLGFDIEDATAAAMRAHAPRLRQISGERVHGELERMFAGPARARALRLLDETHLLGEVLPEAARVAQAARSGDAAARTAWERSVAVLEALGDDADLALSLAVVLGECADGARGGTHTSADDGVDAAADVCARLRASTALTRRVADLVARRPALRAVAATGRPELRRLAASPLRADLVAWDAALARTEGRRPALGPALDDLARWLDGEAFVPPPLITGRDVLAAGMPAGPAVADLLRRAQDVQLAQRGFEREAALRWLHDAIAARG